MKFNLKRLSISLLINLILFSTINAQEEKKVEKSISKTVSEGTVIEETAIEETVIEETVIEETVIEETGLGMNVSGNKELPNVLYIIPWKENSSLKQKPTVSRLVDEIYAPVDPAVFSRQVEFYQQLTTKPVNPK